MNDSTQRDEWARIIVGELHPGPQDDPMTWPAQVWRLADAIVERIKPRTITTVEELDALPEGSIILTPSTNPNYPSVFRKVWRGEWLELDPGDKNDGEYGIGSEGLLRWDSKDHTATVVFEPKPRKATR